VPAQNIHNDKNKNQEKLIILPDFTKNQNGRKFKLHEVQAYKLVKMLLFLFFDRIEEITFWGNNQNFFEKSRHKPIWEPSKASKRFWILKQSPTSQKYSYGFFNLMYDYIPIIGSIPCCIAEFRGFLRQETNKKSFIKMIFPLGCCRYENRLEMQRI